MLKKYQNFRLYIFYKQHIKHEYTHEYSHTRAIKIYVYSIIVYDLFVNTYFPPILSLFYVRIEIVFRYMTYIFSEFKLKFQFCENITVWLRLVVALGHKRAICDGWGFDYHSRNIKYFHFFALVTRQAWVSPLDNSLQNSTESEEP